MDTRKLAAYLKSSHKSNRILMERNDWLFICDGFTLWRLGNREYGDLPPMFVPMVLDKTINLGYERGGDDKPRETGDVRKVQDLWEKYEALPVAYEVYRTGHLYEEDYHDTLRRVDTNDSEHRFWVPKKQLDIVGENVSIHAIQGEQGHTMLRIVEHRKHFVYGKGDVTEQVTVAYVMTRIGPADERKAA